MTSSGLNRYCCFGNGLLYDGSTYVNINNRVYYHSGGRPDWIMPAEDVAAISETELVKVLLGQGYRQVFP